ncbi:MAG TPA: hypothetical protein DCZ92_00970 [Elusimicrobia bacterium]|nr:hypothetical protein [Elusimicrobiota bacterium]
MKTLRVAAVAVLCLLLAQAAAADEKNGAGGLTVLGDGMEFSAASLGLTDGAATPQIIDGAIAGVAYSSSSAGAAQLESGFYSKMVSLPGTFDYSGASASSFTLNWTAANPLGTSYDVISSSWNNVEPYMVFYSTTGTEAPIQDLYPNTSYYNFILANYMDGDYAGYSSNIGVTQAAAVSSGTFRFEDSGHNALNMSFTAFANPAPVEGEPWTQPLSLPATSYGLATVIYGSHVFVSGGYTGIYASSAVYRAEITDSGPGAWQPAGFMPEGLYGHQLVTARGRLYVVGGHSQGAIRAKVWSADISSTGVLAAWESERDLNMPVYFHAAAVTGDWLQVSGGYTTGLPAWTIQSAQFDGVGSLGPWDSATNHLPEPRYAHSMTLVGGRLYVAGGRDSVAARSNVWVFELEPDGELSGANYTYTPLPAPRYGHTAIAAANSLYIIGGNNGSAAQSSVFVSTVSAAVTANAPWAGYPPSGLAATQFASGVSLGGSLFVLGGSNGTSARSAIYTSRPGGTGYFVQVSSDPAFAVDVHSSGWIRDYRWNFSGLAPAVLYYARARSANRLGLATAFSESASAVTYAAIPGTAAWTNIYVTTATAHWLQAGNPDGTLYEVQCSTAADYSGTVPSASGVTGFQAEVYPLLPNSTYYARVRVQDSASGASRYIDLPQFKTGFDAALDSTDPAIRDEMEPNADPVWRSTNVPVYKYRFDDAQANDSGVSYFEVMAATDTGGLTGIVHAWTQVAGGINQAHYEQDWALPWGVWDSLKEGASNYISVRVTDNAGRGAISIDAFSVLKDTTPPQLEVSYSTPAAWYITYPGDIDGLHFTDGPSGLFRLQYSVSDKSNLAAADVIGWTEISTQTMTANATFYDPVIVYNFDQLANGVSNYFSLRACDVAGSTYTRVAAFAIAKNVAGPVVSISTPGYTPAYLSTFTYVSGNSQPTNNNDVLGTEVSIRDLTGGNYYDGTGFLAGTRVWFDAQDAASTFTYAFAGIGLVSGRQYQLAARSSDTAGDYSQAFATYTFRFDTDAPVAQITSPLDGETFSGSSISGTADDVSGIGSVEIALKRLSDAAWWNGSSWAASTTAVTAGNSGTWGWSFPPYLRDTLAHGGQYYATARAADRTAPANTGNFFVYGATFTYADITVPPQTLALTASDGGRVGTVRLTWLASGDNGYTSGYLVAGTFKIAYSTYSGADLSTASAQVTITTTVVTAGTTQHYIVDGLVPGASYYFRLWTADDVPNWSAASPEGVGEASLLNSGALTGSVYDASTQPVTGVLVEALGLTGAVEGSDFTDVFGAYSLSALESPVLTVRAVWAAQDIESSVSKDEVPNGAGGVDFRLSVTYQLAAISGVIPAGYLPRGLSFGAGRSYSTRAVRPEAASRPFAEIYRRGRCIGVAYTDAAGSFEVPNLLPGTYSIRVYNGSDYSLMRTVTLRPGERLIFTPEWELLNKDKVYAYPNPAGAVVHFHFETLPANAEAQVEVFDITGRLIKTLRDITPDAPGRKLTWNISRDSVASGVYLYILRVRSGSAVKSVVKKFAVIR